VQKYTYHRKFHEWWYCLITAKCVAIIFMLMLCRILNSHPIKPHHVCLRRQNPLSGFPFFFSPPLPKGTKGKDETQHASFYSSIPFSFTSQCWSQVFSVFLLNGTISQVLQTFFACIITWDYSTAEKKPNVYNQQG